jgi:hypothetical protein
MAQTIPEDLALCVSCGWMRVSDYAEHMVEALRELLAQAWEEGEDAADWWHHKNNSRRYGDGSASVPEPVNPYRVIPPDETEERGQ